MAPILAALIFMIFNVINGAYVFGKNPDLQICCIALGGMVSFFYGMLMNIFGISFIGIGILWLLLPFLAGYAISYLLFGL